MKSKVKLPEKMSDLIELAVNDAKACEKDPRYELNMSVPHTPIDQCLIEGEAICEVCLAGSIIAKTMGANPKKMVYLDNFDKRTSDKLSAVDSFRAGEIELAFEQLGTKLVPSEQTCDRIGGDICSRFIDGEGRAPWHVYLKQVKYLRSIGL